MRLQDVCKCFGELCVLREFDMILAENKITCILGPSGCGKTTMLNLISGVIKPDCGQITGFENRSISYLFQEQRLLPWKTVAGNIEFVLKDLLPQKQRHSIVKHYINMVSLDGFEEYYPHQLSGGMKQRVAIARAFAYPSDILLMDEPFKALDPQLKRLLMHAFLKVWSADSRTVIFVTHDIQETLLLGNEIFVLTGQPTRVKKHLYIPATQNSRELGSQSMQTLERELYHLVACGGKMEKDWVQMNSA
ncbi:MAG: ABC transporter ATP-binding protein [Firmicutes bacterium]|nr:ABC transporter ATP-binding protein [Bacillota bacterium]